MSLGVLAREVGVRVINCSASGCLLETSGPLEVGTIATIRLTWDGHLFADDLRIVRCQPISGGSVYHVGAEFLWTVAPRRESVRIGLGRQAEGKSLMAAEN